MIEITDDVGHEIKHKQFLFSGGEVQVKIESGPEYTDGITIHADVCSANDTLELFLLTDALRRKYIGTRIYLEMPYLPYARQDRVCDEGEALSLKVFCNLINAQNYETVTIWDCHSDVGAALLNNVTNVHSYELITRYVDAFDKAVLVSPDIGANKKSRDCAKHLNRPLIYADKIRDVQTGAITGTVVHSDVHIGSQDFLIVDDICDGGRTFIELAKKLRPLTDGKVMLYVTHGIFNQGLGVFGNLIDHIYCPNVFPGVEKTSILN
jgi:ribose-phosphate pyrophosphokinase